MSYHHFMLYGYVGFSINDVTTRICIQYSAQNYHGNDRRLLEY